MPRAWAGVAVLFASCPSGINAYLFAERYGEGVAIASSAVALSTALALGTSLLWLRCSASGSASSVRVVGQWVVGEFWCSTYSCLLNSTYYSTTYITTLLLTTCPRKAERAPQRPPPTAPSPADRQAIPSRGSWRACPRPCRGSVRGGDSGASAGRAAPAGGRADRSRPRGPGRARHASRPAGRRRRRRRDDSSSGCPCATITASPQRSGWAATSGSPVRVECLEPIRPRACLQAPCRWRAARHGLLASCHASRRPRRAQGAGTCRDRGARRPGRAARARPACASRRATSPARSLREQKQG